MSITVVTIRDEFGAPPSRDVYAAGARYTIRDADLEISSAQSRPLALYGSGNWLSVYLDDSVQVLRGAQANTTSADRALDAAPSAGADLDAASDAAGDADLDADLDAAGGADPAHLDLLDEPEIAAGPDWAEPDTDQVVSVEADAEAEPEPAGPPPAAGDAAPARASAPEEPAGRSPLLRPVVFAPRTYKTARGEDGGPTSGSTSARSLLRPVVFAPKTYRAARVEDGVTTQGPRSDQAGSRLRPVVFRARTYRAARAEAGPQAHESAEWDRGERSGGPDMPAEQDGSDLGPPPEDGDRPD